MDRTASHLNAEKHGAKVGHPANARATAPLNEKSVEWATRERKLLESGPTKF